MQRTTLTIYGRDFTIEPGSRIRPDNWPLTARLAACDDGFCQYRLLGSLTGIEWAVRIVLITGRSIQRNNGEGAIRVAIHFQGDGEPDQIVPGWFYPN